MRFLPRTRGGLLTRALIGAVLVIGFAAGATATTGLLQINSVVKYFIPGAHKVAGITLPKYGQPETILVIGSDHRKGQPYTEAQTDTMLLIHLDDSSSTVNMMSVPRDLDVLGPGGAPMKLNAAYEEEGGPSGLIKALRQQVFGPAFQVNHVLDVNFTGFADLVNAIGCVYADIDHRYYNVSSAANNFASIDIQPGYQRLCGGAYTSTGGGTNGALAFVRFRHTDSDEVRNARQQDFIRWARDNYSSSQLVSQRGTLLKILGKHTEVDTSFASTNGLIDLANLVIDSNSLTIKSVQFPEYFGPCGGSNSQTPCYVYPCPQLADLTACQNGGYSGPTPTLGQPTAATEAIWNQFVTPTMAKPKSTATTTHRSPAPTRTIDLAGLAADPQDGASQAGHLGDVGLPIEYPKYIFPGAEGVSDTYCYSLTANCDDPDESQVGYIGSYPRRYEIVGPDGTRYKSYVMTLCINSVEGEFYTVQGTTWRDPPLLKKPSKHYRLNNKTLLEFDDGDKIATVAFRTPTGTYWIENTLDNSIPNADMIAMAAEMTPFTGRA